MKHVPVRIGLVLFPFALAACGGQESAAATPGDAGGQASHSVATEWAERPPVTNAPLEAGERAPGAPAETAPEPARATSATGPGTAPPADGAAVVAETEQDRAAQILGRVERTANGIRSLEADFVQTLNVPLLGSEQRSAGKLYQRKPDRFLMKFSEPAGDIMVADGRYFWIYYPSADRTQVIRTGIAEGGEQVDLQRQFLANANARFVATLNGEESVAGASTYVLTLVPKRASPYKILKIWVDKESYLVRRFEMTEENNSVRRVELRNIRTNHAIPDALFTFTPPPGAQVFDQ